MVREKNNLSADKYFVLNLYLYLEKVIAEKRFTQLNQSFVNQFSETLTVYETPSFGFSVSKLFTEDLFGDHKRNIESRLESLNPSVVEPGDSGEALEHVRCAEREATVLREEVASLRDEKALFERRLAASKEATAAEAARREEAEAGIAAGDATIAALRGELEAERHRLTTR